MTDPLVGTMLDGRYRVRRILGEGGMGIVYEAEHELIERRVAIKVLREDFSRRADVVERFRREAKSASRIGHPNIVDVLDFGQTPQGASYFVMELLRGEDLADLLRREIRLSPSRAVAIIVQCCRALAAAHEKGIIHRDLKPENVFIVERGGFPDFVKLVDFGVAKMTELEDADGGMRRLTRTGMIFGTPEYMSPEQANGQTLDHRVDVYALGVLLYESLTGRVPFEGESFMAVLSKHAAAPVPPLRETWPGVQVSPQLDAVVKRALTKSRDQRFPHMRAFCDALEAVPEMPELMPRDSLVPVRASAPSSPISLGVHDAKSASSARAASPASDSSLAPAVVSIDRAHAGTPLDRRQTMIAVGAAIGLAVLALGVLAAPGLLSSRASSELQSQSGEHRAAQNKARSSVSAPTLAIAPVPVSKPTGPAAEPESEPAVAPIERGSSPAAPELVTLTVSTRPSGARLRLAGGDEVCARTPCSFDVLRGTRVSILARRGKQRATATLEPRENADLHLVLGASKSTTAVRERAQTNTVAREGTRPAIDDLKVPDAFK